MFEDLFLKEKFKPLRIFRQGPRVYVVGGRWQRNGGIDAVFKAPFSSDQGLTSLHLRREAIFLKSAPSYLAPLVPSIYDFGQEENGRFWYLVEWVKPGKPQLSGDSDFIMPDTFFTRDNLAWGLNVLSALRLFSGEVPSLFAREISETAYELADYRALLEPLGKKFFDRNVLAQVKIFLNTAEPVYQRANRTAVTHHEFYGSQILSSGKSIKLADWENVGWGHPLRDFTSLWIRSFEHPAWQEKFLDNFRKEIRLDPANFEILFGVEKILQSFGNLTHFAQTKLPEELVLKEKAMAFFRRCILETV